MSIALTIIGLLVGVLSLVYAVITNREKAKLEKIIQSRLLHIAESVEDAKDNTKLAHGHIDEVRRFLNGLKHSKEMNSILDRAAWAEADITAAHRMLKRLKCDVCSLQEELLVAGKFPRNKDPKNPKLIDTHKNEEREDS
jgi:F0F1-type ATP synthase membrane subunit b/b'